MTDLGDYLAMVRKERGFTQRELGFRAGISHEYIAKIEKGKQRGAYHTLVGIAGALGLQFETVLKKAGFDKVYVPLKTMIDVEYDCFSSFNYKTRQLLLKIGPLIEKYLES